MHILLSSLLSSLCFSVTAGLKLFLLHSRLLQMKHMHRIVCHGVSFVEPISNACERVARQQGPVGTVSLCLHSSPSVLLQLQCYWQVVMIEAFRSQKKITKHKTASVIISQVSVRMHSSGHHHHSD